MATTLNNDFILFSTGQTIGASSSATMKNRIINGGMVIAQRGTSFTSPSSGSYTLDRWAVNWVGAAPASVAQVSGPIGFKNALQITGSSSNTAVQLIQRIESYNCSDLSGQTITIQANISVSTPQTVSWQLYYVNSQDNWAGGATLITSGTWSVTTTATVFSATITGLPAGAVNGLEIAIYPNNGGPFTSGTFTITGTQLEVGTVASSFDYRDYGRELAMCQRYYQTISDFLVGGQTAGGTMYADMVYPVLMRASPTGTVVGSVAYANSASAYAINSTTSSRFRISMTLPANSYAYGYGALLTFAAEL